MFSRLYGQCLPYPQNRVVTAMGPPPFLDGHLRSTITTHLTDSQNPSILVKSKGRDNSLLSSLASCRCTMSSGAQGRRPIETMEDSLLALSLAASLTLSLSPSHVRSNKRWRANHPLVYMCCKCITPWLDVELTISFPASFLILAPDASSMNAGKMNGIYRPIACRRPHFLVRDITD